MEDPFATPQSVELKNDYVLGLVFARYFWELKNIYHHRPESKKKKSSEENSGFIHPALHMEML